MFFLIAGVLPACSNATIPFATYRREQFDPVPITTMQEKTIRIANPSAEEPQHVAAIAFDAGGNDGAHFQITKVMAGGRALGTKDVVIPAGAVLEVTVRYEPRNLETTRASYGGWETGQPVRYEPSAPKAVSANAALMGARKMRDTWDVTRDTKTSHISHVTRHASDLTSHMSHVTRHASKVLPAPEAIHRALILLTFDYPQEGVSQIELVGRATPGPNGEISAMPSGGTTQPGECAAGGTTACFTGTFSIDLPGLMKTGPVVTELSGPLSITIDGGTAEIDMNTFPPVVFVVKGNGPGEPLEGKPVGVISIVLSGAPDIIGIGSFDGASLQIADMGFRIRIYLAELTVEDADTTTAPVDFLVNALSLTTTKPLADGKITLAIETTLSANPAANPLVDPFLSGAKVVVVLEGALQLP